MEEPYRIQKSLTVMYNIVVLANLVFYGKWLASVGAVQASYEMIMVGQLETKLLAEIEQLYSTQKVINCDV